MAITIRQQIDDGVSEAAAISLTVSSAQVGDTIVVFHADDFFVATDLTTPTGTACSSYTLQHTLDGGTDDSHCKVWVGTCTTAGGTVVEGTNNTSHERYLGAWVLAGTVNFGSAASTDSESSSTSHVAPSVTPTAGKTDDLLICLFGSLGGAAATDYTMPGGMTARTERDCGIFATFRAADEQLASASATGTRTATASPGQVWMAVSVLMETADTTGTAVIASAQVFRPFMFRRPSIPPFQLVGEAQVDAAPPVSIPTDPYQAPRQVAWMFLQPNSAALQFAGDRTTGTSAPTGTPDIPHNPTTQYGGLF